MPSEECPAGGEHVYELREAWDGRTGWGCAECGASPPAIPYDPCGFVWYEVPQPGEEPNGVGARRHLVARICALPRNHDGLAHDHIGRQP